MALNPHAKYLNKLRRKSPAGFAARYKGLDMSGPVAALLRDEPEDFIANCNGVGSYVGVAGWLLNLLPDIVRNWLLNRLWGMDATPASDLHDNEYTVPSVFIFRTDADDHKKAADDMFLDNLRRMITRDQIFDSLDHFREVKADAYYALLRICGNASFFEGKQILSELAIKPNNKKEGNNEQIRDGKRHQGA